MIVKPILLPWVLVSLLVAGLFAGGTLRFAPRRTIALFVVLQLLPGLAWASRNYVRDGVFTVSSVGAFGARLHLATRTEAWAELGRAPTLEELRLVKERCAAQMDAMSEVALFRWTTATTALIARQHPWPMFRAYLANVDENTSGVWDYFSRQLISYPRLAAAANFAARTEGRLRRYLRWFLLALTTAAAAAALLWRRGRSAALSLCALALPVAFFVAAAGITFWGGPRLDYPAGTSAIAMGAYAIHLGWNALRGRAWSVAPLSA
jgi:hypothetical protein